MHWLLLTEIFPPRHGGSGRWFWELYRRLPRDRVMVGAGESIGQAEFDQGHNLQTERLPMTMPEWGLKSPSAITGYMRLCRAARRIVKAKRVTAVHAGRCLPEGWIAWMLKMRYRTPYLCYVHGEDLNTAETSRELTWMTRRVLSAANVIIANSINSRTLLTNRWCIPKEKVCVLHPGVDTKRFSPVARSGQVRSELGWHDRPVVLTAGRLQKRKGHDQMIRALSIIRRAIPNVLYSIIGDGDERDRLEYLVSEAQLRNNVEFRGECDDNDLIRCYQQCDIFVLANRTIGNDFEGFGMVLVESQACGTPVIAGASGGTAETMRVGETGLIVDCNDHEKLADSACELLLDPDRRQAMGIAGRHWTITKFDWDSLTRDAAKIFEKVPNRRRVTLRRNSAEGSNSALPSDAIA